MVGSIPTGGRKTFLNGMSFFLSFYINYCRILKTENSTELNMKKILSTIIMAAILTSAGAQTTKESSRDKISGALEKTNDMISEILPENSSLLGVQPDACIGKFFPSIPMHFTAGTSFAGTFIKTGTLKDAMTDLSDGISETLKDGNATDSLKIDFDIPANIPAPTAAFTFRLGGIILPFDLGIYGATTFNGIKDITFDDFKASLDYTTLGFDVRYAIMDGAGLLPKFSVGGGYIYSTLSFDFEANKTFETNSTYEINGVTKTYSADLKSEVSLSSKTHTLFAEAQVSKKFLIFEPYIGTKLFVTKTINEYDWKYNTFVDGENQSDLSDSDKNSETKDFGTDNVSTQFFGGLGITLAKFQIALNGAYNVKTNYWSVGLGLNFKN